MSTIERLRAASPQAAGADAGPGELGERGPFLRGGVCGQLPGQGQDLRHDLRHFGDGEPDDACFFAAEPFGSDDGSAVPFDDAEYAAGAV
jgi:hypothetical protein